MGQQLEISCKLAVDLLILTILGFFFKLNFLNLETFRDQTTELSESYEDKTAYTLATVLFSFRILVKNIYVSSCAAQYYLSLARFYMYLLINDRNNSHKLSMFINDL